MSRPILLTGFFLSGLTGLLYQSLWYRMLTLVMGGTTAALTTVLIAFMGGLALGSALFGRFADRTEAPVRAYAGLELGIGLWALGLPWVYTKVPTLYQALHGLDPEHTGIFLLARFGLALLFFGVPATLMGGTLPVMIQALRRIRPELQETVASAYAINTLGATVGAFLAGFVVIPTLGLSLTLYVTGAVNLLLGLGFWAWMRHTSPQVPPHQSATSTPTERLDPPEAARAPGVSLVDPGTPMTAAPSRRAKRLLLVGLFFLMGASSLSYELLWHRLLGLSFGSSVYAVSTMLTTFLLGIGLGSLWWGRHTQARLVTLGWIEIGIAVGGAFTSLALAWLPHAVQYLYLLPYLGMQLLGTGGSDAGFWLLQAALFLLGVLGMGIPTCLMGASFPLAVALYAQNEASSPTQDAAGSQIGKVYAANTLGSIVGLALTGFVLIETFGAQRVSNGFTLLNGSLGVAVLLWGGVGGARALAAALAVLATLFLPRWDIATLTSGVYYHTLGARDNILGGELVETHEDDLGLVSVHRSQEWDQPHPIAVLKFNGKFMGAEGQRLAVLQQFAHLPLLMHGPGARQALVIGLGGGFTVEAALAHPLESLDAVEISAGVIAAARTTRPSIFSDPRLKVIEADARSLVLTTAKRYNVIISETSDPWMTGVSNLYTLEFFQWLRRTLAPGGVFGTWLQVRHKRQEDIRTIFATMRAAFPHMIVAELGEGDLMLLLSDAPLKLDAEHVRRTWAALKAPLEQAHVRGPWSLPGKLVLDEPTLNRYIQGAPINTDDLPVIEFRTPRSLNIGLRGAEVQEALRAVAPVALDLPLQNAQAGDRIQWEVARALWLGRSVQARSLLESAEALADMPELERRWQQAVALFRVGLEREKAGRPGKPDAAAGTGARAEVDDAQARQAFRQALEGARQLPADPRQALLVAGCLLHLGELEALEDHLAHGPGWPEAASEQKVEVRITMRRALLLESVR